MRSVWIIIVWRIIIRQAVIVKPSKSSCRAGWKQPMAGLGDHPGYVQCMVTIPLTSTETPMVDNFFHISLTMIPPWLSSSPSYGSSYLVLCATCAENYCKSTFPYIWFKPTRVYILQKYEFFSPVSWQNIRLSSQIFSLKNANKGLRSRPHLLYY